uniref:Uncharacterized protein n=1 Tax=Anguilla anguilla TaxID=7936 RepID=A0A0E9W7C2_ANGAN
MFLIRPLQTAVRDPDYHGDGKWSLDPGISQHIPCLYNLISADLLSGIS